MNSLPRRAGISVPLFSLRSTRSWGIGEIGDIPFLAAWLHSARQSVLQLLPMNELAPGETSPYSALSAMAIDPQFISIWMLDDAPALEETWRLEIDEVQSAPRIDYGRVRRLKGKALAACFDRFYELEWLPGSARAGKLRSYIAGEAWWLKEYSVYRALRRKAGERPWMEWPQEIRDREPGALVKAREELSKEILFCQYLQWIAAEQWQSVRMGTEGVDILGDFPFMVTLDSADIWSRRRDFILDASVGTPPDAFSETGQEWGLPPYDWNEAWNTDFAWLRARSRRCAELYDGFRVDHLVGFYRTYVRPLDGRPPDFRPVREDEQRTLGETIMRLMMETAADISVEDLGTVPDFVRASIAALGLPGYKVLRWDAADPATYPPVSVAMTGTHDTEPIASWWEWLSPAERSTYGAMPSLSAAHPEGAAGFDTPVFDNRIRDAIIQAVLGAGSNLVMLPVQDVFGWRDRINEPATVNDMNWTYVLPWPVDRMSGVAEVQERAARMAEWSVRSGRHAHYKSVRRATGL